MRKSSGKKALLYFCGFFFFLCLGSCKESTPEILSINPRVGNMGDVLTIRGSGFGEEKEDEAYVTIAGTPPTNSSYVTWTDEEIAVKIPEFGEAGLVYVHRGRKKSNPVLFTNQTTLPVFDEGSETGSAPRITSISPGAGAIGTLVTIEGSNFGVSREGSAVYFSWHAESSAPVDITAPDFVEVPAAEFGYEFWSDREIRVRVPDGAVSGNVELRTPRGNSPPVYFEIAGKPGTKIFSDKRSYILSYNVDVRIDRASLPNNLYIWMPQPAESASQRNIRLLSRNIEPFVENYRGTSLFQFIDTLPQTGRTITVSYVAEVYAVETSVRNQNPVRLNSPPPAETAYTLSSALIPAAAPEVKAKAAEITGRERLPYAKARRIYNWLVSSGGIEQTALSGGVSEALEEQRADSYRASLLFCALARASGIPALPVAGVLIDRQRNTARHYWAEFWLDGFGWVPVDPALGAGAAPDDFNLREDRADYYFGSLDNQRVAFSRGERLLSPMSPNGRTALRVRDYSLQNLWEEAVGGLESYSSLWSGVTITGMYVQ